MSERDAIDQAEQDALDGLKADYEAAVERIKARFAKIREVAPALSTPGYPMFVVDTEDGELLGPFSDEGVAHGYIDQERLTGARVKEVVDP